MFESLDQLDRSATVAAAAECVQTKMRAGCALLEFAAHWADLHPPEGLEPRQAADVMVGERVMQLGGSGTPAVAEFAPAELAPEVEMNVWEARSLLADALDLRHRLRRLWRRVQAGQVHDWRARRVARRTRELPAAIAAEVDREVAGTLGGLSSRQIDNRVAAAVKRADRERAEREAEEAARSRHVTVCQSNEHGITDIHVRTDSADAIVTNATLNQIADILIRADREGRRIPGVPDRDARTRDEWRAVAHGVMGVPLLASWLLTVEANRPADDDPDHDDSEATATDREAAPGPGGAIGRIDWIPGWGGLVDNQDLSPAVPVITDIDGGRLDPRWWRPVDPATVEETIAPAASLDEPVEPELLPPDPLDDPPDRRGEPSDRRHQSAGSSDPGAEQRIERTAGFDREVLESWLRDLDPAKAAPKVTLHVHLTDESLRSGEGVARVEGIGPVLLSQASRWLGANARIRLLPVLDVAGIPSVDAYEIPARMAEAIRERHPTSVFPYSDTDSRRADLDHTNRYLPPPIGPPGQTGVHNLGPLARPEHRYETHGPIQVRQPEPGVYLWRTPYQRVLITTPAGTYDIGVSDFADAVWQTAKETSPALAG